MSTGLGWEENKGTNDKKGDKLEDCTKSIIDDLFKRHPGPTTLF